MSRIVGLRWTPVDAAGDSQARRLLESLEASGAWTKIVDWRGLVLLYADSSYDGEPILLMNGNGAIFGSLFSKDGQRVCSTHDSLWAEKLAVEGGEGLTRDYWGAYLAVLIDRGHDRVHVVRDPTGARACYFARRGDVWIFVSHAADWFTLCGATDVALPRIAAFLINPALVSSHTALVGLSELQAGEVLTFDRVGMERRWAWRPDDVEVDRRCIVDADHAARKLNGAARVCASAWGRSSGRKVLRLSGGLDSSIVLGLLSKEAPEADLVCVNEYSDVTESDERPLARLAAARCGKRLIEVEMRPEAVSYERALDAPATMSPTLSILGFADPTLRDIVKELGADMVITGQGGDHILQRRRTPLLAADAVRLGARHLFGHCSDVARLTGRSIWEVAGVMLVSGFMRCPLPLKAMRWPRSPLLSEGLTEQPKRLSAPHDWMGARARLPPAQALRLWHLLDASRYHAPSILNSAFPCVPVLLSQPLVEVCLSIPTFVMALKGCERGLARAAFAEVLPPEIRRRQLKGETTRYFAAVLTRNFDFLRAALLEGELSASGMLDRTRLEAALNRGAITDGIVADGLLTCLAAEIWLQALRRRNAEKTTHSSPDSGC